MQALLYSDWEELEIRDVDVPTIAPDEVLLRVEACGICGSELETFKNRSPRRTPPLVMGHEFCGTIEAVGQGAGAFSEGDRVVSNSVVPCGSCVRCKRGDSHLCASRQIFGMHRPGAFAEYVAVPARCLMGWPAGLPASSACLAEPLANGIHVYNLTRTVEPKVALVIGSGPIGLMCQQIQALLAGATIVASDVIPERRAVAKALGAEVVVDPMVEDPVDVVRSLTSGEGADLVIDAVGSGITKRQSIAASRPGGTVVWIGLHGAVVEFDTYEVTLPERTVLGTYAARLPELEHALSLMAAGAVDVASWVQTFPLVEGRDAFYRMLAGQGADIKGVLLPTQN